MTLCRRASPQPMDHATRKRLWWKATRLSFVWQRHAITKRPRQEIARMLYRVFIRHPRETLSREVDTG